MHGKKLVLAPLAAGIFAAATFLARSDHTPQPDATPPPPPVGSWRAIGTLHPRIAPDGKDAVFSFHGGIWRVPVEGGVARRLAAGPGYAVEPCWSPDGRRFAFLQ